MKTAFYNGHILAGQDFAEGLAVLVEHGRILAVVKENDAQLTQADTRIDLNGQWLMPGFIDVQVNGGGGVLFNNAPSVDTLRQIMRSHRRFGTTGMLPTLISDDVEVMAQAIAAVRTAMAEGVPGILGIHLEGPYIAEQRKGTHNPEKFRILDADEIKLVTSLDNGVTMMTLAPECVPGELIRQLAANGVIIAAGHTAATYGQTCVGLDAGISGFTHLFNAMTALQGREPGVVGAALDCPHSWCGVIVDSVHVHPASLRVALAAKPRGKVVLVTDAMPMVGADDPSFTLYGEVITARDGVVRNAAGSLAGSALDMATAVRNTVDFLGVPFAEAVRMASTYPAQWIGLGANHGKIEPGFCADFVLMDDVFTVQSSWIAGQQDEDAILVQQSS